MHFKCRIRVSYKLVDITKTGFLGAQHIFKPDKTKHAREANKKEQKEGKCTFN